MKNILRLSLSIYLIISTLSNANAQNFISSNLPIIKINTGGGAIFDEPKKPAVISVIDNGKNKRNFLTD